jgi:hypothetical protein
VRSEEVSVQKPLTAVVVALLSLSAVALTAQTKPADPWLGTWKVDLAKSTFSPGPAPTVAATMTIERSGSGMKTTITNVDAEGKPVPTETLWAFDGKDNPVKGAQAPNTTAAYKRIDDRTFEVTSKVDGKTTVITRIVVSADGKTLTATQTGTNPQGQSVKNVIVGVKQ